MNTPRARSRACASSPGRGDNRASRRTASATSAAPRACSSPALPGTSTPRGRSGRPSARAHRRATAARTSPWAARAGRYRHRCDGRIPWCVPPAPSSRHRTRRRESARSRRTSRRAPADVPTPTPSPLGQNQKPRVVPNQMQTPKLHRAVPAQPPVARGALERPRLPPQQRQPPPAPHRDVAQPPARKLPEPQIVVPVHERVPAPSLIAPGEPHLDLADHHLRLVERIRHIPLIDETLRKSQTPASRSCRHRFAASVK